MTMPCSYCSGTIVEDVCEDCGKSAKKNLVTAASGGLDITDAVATASMTTGRTRGSARFTVNYPARAPGAGATKSTRRRAGVSTHTSARRTALGGGLISLPDLPSQDPLKLLMADPEVPAHKRHCPKCDVHVNRAKGFCPACGTPYDFVARLKMGDVIAGKYEIKGPIAFGGLGWIYLGWDQVLQRWVVLKGLLNANDEASAAAAVAERRYLAALKHPKIVNIYDFVNQGAEGFIIMEYVGGQTVHSLRKQRGPLPVTEAIAYILGILPAFAYLHTQGLVYCDFKPDNIMIEGGDVKLIDMGAVRKTGDQNGDIYATLGFAAPEADTDPIAVSDLYTLGRALAVLIMDFKFTSDYEYALPSPDDHDVLAENESLYRFLLRATHVDPDERFQTADEMAEQLFGVLREIVALQSGPKPVDSKVFTSDNLIHATARQLVAQVDPHVLPTLRVNLEDKAASEVIRILSLMDEVQQVEELQALVTKYGDRAAEPRLRLAEVLIQNAGLMEKQRDALIKTTLDAVEAADPFDWRTSWLRGLCLVTNGDGAKALAYFERCYFEMPGELAPRLAMGLAAEIANNGEQALPYYDRVGRVDPSFVSAHAGAARCHAKAGRLMDAVSMLQRVPSNHVLHTQVQLGIAELLLTYPDAIDASVMQKAEAAVKSVLNTGGSVFQIAGRLINLVVEKAKSMNWPPNTTFLGANFTEHTLRLAAEEQFRRAAKLAKSDQERHYWVSQANRVRPVTLF
ncbi:tetratricopeptide repeat protein [Undibacterium sp. RTI2.1]|uniref:tetratricopeptide repeat protein n=1 Tax=unclassified Undibacterium TaxID=2630295 RepID=UPI002AB531B7|nr:MULTISPECIES: tetratricopeptide repeat protein [unclassified Undibacterium]MDY7540157.1 tetratricopeptide repeat protein [Undibacterium sp. 5I1]MEB0030331.1 tetratricopeptide repeat protein [Undibacterium sp. RTI2.1]MEB0115389.1 tetratricopeptide repeat protein [Undibacterium sp. RTI2.2]MEB0230596.1 tetratricopeptide repeat protein [Undibacterium sp. 10I3]MEB0257084.1 tetratricopeptide repeat protein [Undibacterium sp. 5I1]